MAGLAARRRTARGSADAALVLFGPLPRIRPRRWSTPARVRAGAAAAVLLTGCLCALLAVVSGRLAGEFVSVGQQDAPRVSAATGLYFALNDMDAQVANLLLTGGDAALAADRSQDLASYASDRAEADRDLQQAIVSEANDAAALGQLRAVLDRLGQYESLAADALLTDQTATGASAGRPSPDIGGSAAGRAPAAAVGYYQQAADLMQAGILPSVSTLTAVSSGELDRAYQAGLGTTGTGRAAVAGAGALLAAVLVALQAFLVRRYRRMFNPALAAATVLAVALTAAAAVRLDAASGDLRVAKHDAFDSILALTEARAVSYDANADESRYLVDPGRAAQYQQAFLRASQQLAAVGPASIATYDAALAAEVSAYQRDSSDVRFGGYLGAEFRNITFPGERAAAVTALLAYQRYEKDDRTLRALAGHNLTAAVAYDVGTARGQSDWAFNQYSVALASVTAINQRAFGAALQAGQATVGGWEAGFPAAGGVLLAGLTLAGVRRRLAEYR
jgi:hypothetical protein